MSERVAWWVAWVVCGLTLAMIAGAVALAVPNQRDAVALGVPVEYGLRDMLFLLTEASAALVGALIASRRPRNPVGWLVSAHALCFTLGEFGRQYAIFGLLTEPGSLPLARVMASPPYWVWYPGLMAMTTFLPLFFPDGRLVSRRWRPVAWLAVFLTVFLTAFAVVRPSGDETRGIPNPLGVESLTDSTPLFEVFAFFVPTSWVVIGLLSVAGLVVRFRRSRGVERQQLKWVAFAAVLFISWAALERFLLAYLPPIVDEVLFVVSLQGLWVAIAVAVLRYHLFDIDVIVNRTLVYGALTAALALVYLGGVAASQAIFRALTGGDQQSQLAIVVSTLVIAALFNPLRRRIQSFIDRRFYRRKYDAARTLEAFAATLRDETDLERLGDDLVRVVGETVQPSHASLWLRAPAADRRASG
ncbi:MAG TPA: hypothetical protein VHH10_02355 [Rubrobacteraceae bacterium]|nr:hypothetical protein [Rubrobacteraceae bacterium]